MRASKRNRKSKVKQVKQTRNTRQKEIEALAKRGNVYGALKAARGWRIEADPAHRLVELWQAVEALEQNPQLESGAPEGCSRQQLTERAQRIVRYFVLSRDADFFVRVAKRLRQPEPVEDDLQVAEFADLLKVKCIKNPDGSNKIKRQEAKAIASEARGQKKEETALREVNRNRKRNRGVDK